MGLLTNSYASILADVTDAAYLQCEDRGHPGTAAEIIVAGSAPQETDAGILLRPGETMDAAQLAAIAGAGAIYARSWLPTNGPVTVRVIAVAA